MNNRFKFRLWNYDKKRMEDILAIGEIRDGLPRDMIITDSPDEQQDYYSTNDLIDVCTQHNLVVMQCTGLKDKNGKLIYEGDIVYNSIVQSKYIVVFVDGSFMQQSTISNSYLKSDKRFDEVIGNIYENPELLEAT